jgi:beta-galactosidase GanA
MKILLKYLVLLSAAFNFNVCCCQDQIPFLQEKGNTTQLIVDGIPFIILGGELGNSSATTMEYMKPIWSKLKVMHLNTILMPVYWELIESEEGKFDFSLLEKLITEARKNELRIIFLWFASWKNSMSSHAPAWVKLNQEIFPRIKDNNNRSHEILTPLSENNLQADLKAFKALMGFIKKFDGKNHTVIMVQVENEIGMLPVARDYSSFTNEFFNRDVPAELINYLKLNKSMLVPELLEIWRNNGFKTSGNWEEIFGKGVYTDEIFMAWYYSSFTNKIVEAGKKIYPIPMYVNAALNRPNTEPGTGYPSGGPLPHLMDVWKAGGPSIDFLAPDIYFPDFKHWTDLYTRQGDLLFIPEHRFDNTAAAKSLFAFGHYEALGFAPFSIESTDKPENEPIGKAYNLVSQLEPIIFNNQGLDKIEGVLLDKKNRDTIINLGGYELTVVHDFTFPWSAGAKEDEWPLAGGIIIQTGENEFYVAGTGIIVTFKPLNDKSLIAGILKAEEGTFENNNWVITRHLNGDQTHQGRHVRIPSGEFSIQRFSLYTYK